MAGSRAKPADLLDGHRSKDEIEARKEAEQSIYTGVQFREHKAVRESPVAHAEFNRLKRLFKNIQYVDALDEQIINRYCLEIAQVDPIEKLVEKMEDDVDECKEASDRIALYKAISGTLQVLARKKAMLLTMEDRLYLNPTARMRSIPKAAPKAKPKNPMEEAGFNL
jgi:phage terminase small subunit